MNNESAARTAANSKQNDQYLQVCLHSSKPTVV